jgi:hypothetical protein
MSRITKRQLQTGAVMAFATGLVGAVFAAAQSFPALSEHEVGAQELVGLTITGVAPNNSSTRVYYQPVTGAKDYRIYDVAKPTDVKYAGLVHLTPSPLCPGSACLQHFAAQADGVTPVFPYQVANGPSGGPQVLDVPATDIEWNGLGDGQQHILVVEAVDQLGPVPQANLYAGLNNTPLVNPGGMLGSNKGRTNDGNVSTNGQGPFANVPQPIARSQQFVTQARPDLKAIPSRPSATQQFYDTFENAENATLKQLARQDSATDAFGNLGSMTYSMNAGTPKEWTIEYRQADNQDSMPFVASDHFMDMLFDGATPNTTAPTHTIYGSMSMTPHQALDISGGKVVHLTMEVDGHQSFRRWLAFDLAPASDPLQGWDPGGHPISTSDQGMFVEIRDSGCTLDIFTGPKSASDSTPTGTAGGNAHGARLWGGSGAVGGGAVMCSSEQMYNPAHFSRNGLGLDDRSRFDFFLTQDHAALFEDGQLIVQSDIPAGSFPWANMPLKAYYSHYLYHSDADIVELSTFNLNGDVLCYPENSYWFNDPVNGTTPGKTICNTNVPAGYGFPYSDERHWDNMGFEVWPAADLPAGRDFAALASSVQPPQVQAPQFVGGSLAIAGLAVPSTPAPAPVPVTVAGPQRPAAQWVAINPPGVSLDFTSASQNYGFNSIVTDAAIPGTVYMGTNYQGIYKSTDRGTTWVKVDTGPGANLIDAGRVWALAIDPFNHSTLYAASGYGSGGPLKSVDGGVSWSHTLPSTNAVAQQIGTNDIYNVAVDPFTPDHLLASFHFFWYGSQDSGVLESMDGGATWAIHNPPPGSGWGAGNSVWFLDDSQTWLVGSQEAGLWRTANSGQTWAHVSTANIAHGGIYSLYRSASTGMLYSAVWNGILKSTDDGLTWQSFVTGLPYAAYESLIGDGTNLYTAPSFPVGGDNGQAHVPWYTVAENGGTTWKAFDGQTPCSNNVCNGPVQLALDVSDGTVYSANWNAGVWKLETGVVPVPAATNVPTDTPPEEDDD